VLTFVLRARITTLADVICRVRLFGVDSVSLQANLAAQTKSKSQNLSVRLNHLAFRHEQTHAKWHDGTGYRFANINTLRRRVSIQGNMEGRRIQNVGMTQHLDLTIVVSCRLRGFDGSSLNVPVSSASYLAW
jgi:hypothetical protein